MSKISKCPRCGGNIVEPAYPGDGAYPIAPMCSCAAPRFIPLDRQEIAALDDDDREAYLARARGAR